jgi:beta-ketoacyl-acyl-carrier-protein synthase II
MTQRRVVVTGIGVVCPVGNDLNTTWQNVSQGKSGIGFIRNWDTSKSNIKIAGEVKDFDPTALFGRREARRIDRVTQLAWAAAQQAVADAGLQITDENRNDIGILVGTGIGGLNTIVEGTLEFAEKGHRGVSPLLVPMMLPDTAAGKISIEFGVNGPNMTLSTACATGNNAIGEAASWIQRGMCEIVIAGASEAGLNPVAMASFDNMTALTRNPDPSKACRPFERDRDGFVIAEGAAILILESLEGALARGAKIYGEVLGYGFTSDAYHATAPAPDGEGARRAMAMALKSAGLGLGDIDYVNAHGTGTPLNDHAETLAMKKLFGERVYEIPVSSTKSMTGHMLGAAAAVEAAISLMVIRDQFVPPTLNLDQSDPECDLDYVPHVGRPHPVQRVMSNAFGFGGHNVVIILGRYNGE